MEGEDVERRFSPRSLRLLIVRRCATSNDQMIRGACDQKRRWGRKVVEGDDSERRFSPGSLEWGSIRSGIHPLVCSWVHWWQGTRPRVLAFSVASKVLVAWLGWVAEFDGSMYMDMSMCMPTSMCLHVYMRIRMHMRYARAHTCACVKAGHGRAETLQKLPTATIYEPQIATPHTAA